MKIDSINSKNNRNTRINFKRQNIQSQHEDNEGNSKKKYLILSGLAITATIAVAAIMIAKHGKAAKAGKASNTKQTPEINSSKPKATETQPEMSKQPEQVKASEDKNGLGNTQTSESQKQAASAQAAEEVQDKNIVSGVEYGASKSETYICETELQVENGLRLDKSGNPFSGETRSLINKDGSEYRINVYQNGKIKSSEIVEIDFVTKEEYSDGVKTFSQKKKRGDKVYCENTIYSNWLPNISKIKDSDGSERYIVYRRGMVENTGKNKTFKYLFSESAPFDIYKIEQINGSVKILYKNSEGCVVTERISSETFQKLNVN